MKRIHIHVAVDDLAQNIAFYSLLFGSKASVIKPDYAKWLLENPKINFAISTGHSATGIRHLGIQVDSMNEFEEINENLNEAKQQLEIEDTCSCCYAISDKTWVNDPQGINWETFITYGEETVYGRGKYQREIPDAQTKESLGQNSANLQSSKTACDSACSIA